MSVESNSAPAVVLLEAGEAAQRLGVSASGLRRLSGIYEKVYGELPRKPKTHNRLWPAIAIERLERARALVDAQRFSSIVIALQALEDGYKLDITVDELQAGSQRFTGELFQLLLDELTEIRHELAMIHEDNAALRQELKQIAALTADESAEAVQTGLRAEPELQSKILEMSSQTAKDTHSIGVLVRIAMRLERWLKRKDV